MAQEQHISSFTGKMNLDVANDIIPQGDYKHAMNFDNNNASNSTVGQGSNVLGNTKITNPYINTDDKEIASAFNIKLNASIVFIYNATLSYQKILYVSETEVKLLLQASWLNFPDKYIDAKCYDDYVVWTDGVNDPRIFNIVWMLNYRAIMIAGTGIATNNWIIYSFKELQYDYVVNTQYVLFYNLKLYRLDTTGLTGILREPPDPTYQLIGVFNTETYLEVNSDTIKLIASPPTILVEYNYFYDKKTNYNNIYGKLFTFTYKYEYIDGRLSTLCPFSVVIAPRRNETEDGYRTLEAQNSINVTVNTGTRDVSKIHIYFKNIDEPNSIFLLTTIDKLDLNNNVLILSNISYTVYFYNDKRYLQYSASEINRLFDYIPKTVNRLDIISDGRIILGDIIKEIPEVPDVVIGSLEEINISSKAATPEVITYTQTPKTVTIDNHTTNYTLINFNLPLGYQVGMSLTMDFNVNFTENVGRSLNTVVKGVGNFLDPKLTNADALFKFFAGFCNRIRNIILFDPEYNGHLNDTLPPSIEWTDITNNTVMYAEVTQIIKYWDEIGLSASEVNNHSIILTTKIDDQSSFLMPYTGRTITINSITIEYESISKIETIKSNSILDVGIQYYDKELRSTGFHSIGGVHLSDINWGTLSGVNKEVFSKQIKVNITSIPPIDAFKYALCISENKLYSDYIQIMVTDVTYSTGKSSFSINRVISRMKEDNQNLNLEPWILEKGDRLKFVAKYNSIDDYTYINPFDVEILYEESTSGKFVIPNATLVMNDIVEIYRLRKTIEDADNDIYFETGDLMLIQDYGTENRRHVGTIQTQTDSLPCITALNYYNAYIMQRYSNMDTATYRYFIESKSFSDYYGSKIDKYGRPTIMANNRVFNGTCMLRFGGRLLPSTKMNYINKFDYNDYAELSSMFGTISKIVSKGDTIQIFQTNKVTSFYINKTSIKEADGGEQVLLSDKVLNNKNISDTDFGCVNPESIIRKDSHIIFFDANNGCFVRSADNGLFNISQYGITEYSKQLGRDVLDTGIEVISGYDERTNRFIFSIPSKGDTITFDDSENKWVSFHSYAYNNSPVRLFGTLSNFLLSFINGNIFVHNNLLYNKLFEEDVETTVTTVVNPQPLTVKIFNYLTLIANSEWLPNNYGDIRTQNQFTRVRKFFNKEGRYVNDIKRNMLYPNGVDIRPDENSGEVMRGRWIEIKLRISGTVKKTITSIITIFTNSEKKM